MSRDGKKLIGLIIGRERELPEMVISLVNESNDVRAEMVKLGGTFLDDAVPYDVIIDRMSHEIPYYRAYVSYAALQGCCVINDPFVWSNDTKFLAAALLRKLGLKTPRTMVLPNKEVAAETVPDSFRNLEYPMNWQAIVDYIGGPGIFKDIRSGGRRFAHRVNSIDELIQRYDESGTRTMILQQVIETDRQYHCMVIAQEDTLVMPFSIKDGRYHDLADELSPAQVTRLAETARLVTAVYGYDINMVEFAVQGDEVYLINATNPSPLIGHDLMTNAQFDWCGRHIALLAMQRAREPRRAQIPLNLPEG